MIIKSKREKTVHLTWDEEDELIEHAIVSHWKYFQRQGYETLGYQQPAPVRTEIDERQRKVTLKNVNGPVGEAHYSYKNGKFRCRWLYTNGPESSCLSRVDDPSFKPEPSGVASISQ
ncbi:MAG: hypothetical protein WCH57_12310 [Verrucomicrobiota bacterium]